MSLDPDVKALVDAMAANDGPALSDLTPEEARATYRAMGAMLEAVDIPIGQVEDRTVANDVPVRIYTPVAGSGVLPVIVFFHGGGWVIGDLDTHDAVCRALANESHAKVVAVDYRLAPEHRYPAALEDCYSVVQWVEKQASEINVDPNRIAVAGDSAGGNLAACVCLKSRDEKGPAVGFQLLIYPVIDQAATSGSRSEFAEGYFLEQTTMRWFSDHYMGSADWSEPLASPLHAADHSNLPPAFVITAGYDILRDEGKAYADALAQAGVDVTYKDFSGMIHGFFNMQGAVGVAREAIKEAGQAVEAAFK